MLEGLLSLVVGAAIGVGFVFAVSTGYQEICKARTYANMEEEAADLASASVCVTYVLESNGGASQSYGRIGSGVVFARDGSTYYAITASHVVGDADTGTYTFHVMTYASESFEEFAASSAYNGLVSYYADYLAEATIEYVSDESDLAVISFESADELGVVAVADATPNRGERICTCALIDGEPFTVTYGTITSGETTFSTRDYAGENIVLKHSAYITAGSSGSAAVNEEGELVGITIGGVTSVFGTFRCGALIPADQVQACIEEFWQQQAA